MKRFAVVAAMSMLVSVSAVALAAGPSPGDLDHSFGTGGKSKVPFGSADTALYDVALLPSNAILAVGWAKFGASYDFVLVKFTPNGKLDTKFGGGDGVATADFGANDGAYGLEVQPNGKILVAGYTCPGSDCDAALARFTSGGVLDPGFASGGKATLDLGADETGKDVKVQPDGDVILGGNTNLSTGSYHGFLARYTPGGDPDPAFGSGGVADPGNNLYLQKIALVSGGKVVVGGGTQGPFDFALERFDSTGQPDGGFGTGGMTTTDFDGGYDSIYAMVVRSDGAVIAGGQTEQGSLRAYGLARYTPAGMLDTSFGSNGTVVTQFGTLHAEADGLAVQTDGKILAAGFDRKTDTDELFALARYKPNGVLDSSFGSGGKVTTDITPGDDEASGAVVQTSGRIVVVGFAGVDAGLVGYLGGRGPGCTAFGTKGANVIGGTKGADVLCGLAGGDHLKGLAGRDWLDGGAGNDSLNGGPGIDTCKQGAGTGPKTSCEH